MKLAVISDVHGNLPALEVVLDDIERWRPDQLIVNGDLVSRGPYSLACLRLLQRRQPHARFLRGNHETFVLECASHEHADAAPGHVLRRFAYWTCAQLGEAVQELRHWDDHYDRTDLHGGASLHVTHGSRLGNRDGLKPETDERELQRKLGARRDLFVGSHTHRPMLRHVAGTLVANTGSVGQPFDGDPRAAYGRFVLQDGDWQAQIVRVRYDKAQAEQDFIDSGFLEQCGPIAHLIFQEHRHNRMLVGTWMGRYAEGVAAGEFDAEQAVNEYLQALSLA